MKRIKILLIVLGIVSINQNLFAQKFEALPINLFYKDADFRFGKFLQTSSGPVLITSSKVLFQSDKMQISIPCSYPRPTNDKGTPDFLGKNSNIRKDLYESVAGIKLLCESPDSTVYIVTNNNNIGWIDNQEYTCIWEVPFNFQGIDHKKNVTSIWSDRAGILYIGTDSGQIYYVENLAKVRERIKGEVIYNFRTGLDKDSNYVVISGALPIKSFSLGAGIIPFSFAANPDNDKLIFIGTNEGLYGYDKKSGKSFNYFQNVRNGKCTISKIEPDEMSFNFWFSTLEKGMGKYNIVTKDLQFFRYPKKKENAQSTYPIATFSRKSPNEIFVAIADSTPAVFNTETGKYSFISDTSFHVTENKTLDILIDKVGTMMISKGGSLFVGQHSELGSSTPANIDSSLVGPIISWIMVGNLNYRENHEFQGRIEDLKEINLKYDENNLWIYYSCRGINPDSLIFAWNIDGNKNSWVEKEYSAFGDASNAVPLSNFSPGKYTLRIRAKKRNANWLAKEATIVINIHPPFWKTWWFWPTVLIVLFALIYPIVRWRIHKVRKEERTKATKDKEILELEAKALRAQMNPHFIFNCLNSIKAVIQKDEKDKAISYLTTFSKLIRTIFQNSDKREITLFDELETCWLYTELESLRFGSKLSFKFSIQENMDLKSVMVPALIIQPFIENAIWHGLMPKEEGGRLEVQVSSTDDKIYCIVDDNGIGRKISMENKSFIDSDHDSKGVRLTQTRLELSNSINQTNATVEIIDKTTGDEASAGTRVILTFSKE